MNGLQNNTVMAASLHARRYPNQHTAALSRVENVLSDMGNTFTLFREELATIKTEQANQKQQIVNIEADWKIGLQNVGVSIDNKMLDVTRSIDKISAKIEEKDKPRTSLWIAAFSVLLVVASSIATVGSFFVTSSIREAVVPLQQKVSGLEQLTANHHDLEDRTSRSREADARSETDRQELNRRLATVESALSDSNALTKQQLATLQAGFVENETQFKNLTGQVYVLWDKIFGRPYPIIPREVPVGKN